MRDISGSAGLLFAGIMTFFLLRRLGFSGRQRAEIWWPGTSKLSIVTARQVFLGSLVAETLLICVVIAGLGSTVLRLALIVAFFLAITTYGVFSLANTGQCGCGSPIDSGHRGRRVLMLRNLALGGCGIIGAVGPSPLSLKSPLPLVLPGTLPLLAFAALFFSAGHNYAARVRGRAH